MEISVVILVLSSLSLFLNVNSLEQRNGKFENFNRYPSVKINEASATSYPCPNATEIIPCECYIDEMINGSVMDCSLAKNEHELRDVFTKTLSTNDFKTLKIVNNSHLVTLKSGVFGSSTFLNIEVSGVNNVHKFDSDIFHDMSHVLKTISYEYSGLRELHYDFTNFPHLNYFDAAYNDLYFFNMTSPTVYRVSLSYNNLSTGNFSGDLPNIGMLFLPWNLLDEVPDLSEYKKLELLHMSGNPLSNLTSEVLCQSDVLTTVYLGSTGLTGIGNDSICIKDGAETVRLGNNQITTLNEEDFGPIVENLLPIPEGLGLQLDLNPLECLCDIAWIFANNYTDRISADTKCANGVFFNDIDPAGFAQC